MVDLEDPLEAYRGLSLFPRTFASHSNPPMPYDPDDLHYMHNFLNSVPIQDPDKLIKQAKSILDSASESPTTEMRNYMVSKEINAVVAERCVESPRGRRPGLGRKRARFSLLPNPSQTSANLEPTLDIDKLRDPEEFFMAFERLENAKREIAKQTGCVSIDSIQYGTSMATRIRRPGIPGRSRMVKYQHLYPAMSSQVTLEENISSPSGHISQNGTTHSDGSSQEIEPENIVSRQGEPELVASDEMKLAGSIMKAEKRVDVLLDELLTHNYEELDGDGALTLLQDRLQIKPLDIEKLNLPELQSFRKIDLKASGGSLPKRRKVLSDIHNLLKGTRSRNSLKQRETYSSVSSFGSPTPPKSPLALLSLLKKNTLPSNPSIASFSPDDIDQSLPSNTSPTENIRKCSDSVDLEKDLSTSGKLNSVPTENDDIVVGNISDKVANGSGGDVNLSKSCADLRDNNVGRDVGVRNENLSSPAADADICANEQDELKVMAENRLQEAVTSAQPNVSMDDFTEEMSNIQNQLDQSIPLVVEDHTMDGSSKTQDTASEQHNENIQEPPVVLLHEQTKLDLRLCKERISSKKSLSVDEDNAKDGCSKTQDTAPEETQGTVVAHTQDTAPEQHNENIQEPSVVLLNERVKAKSRPHKNCKNGASARRQSLAASGTSWESGVRRSTRIRSRPLEYWKGERFLYGRIHGSLATVIGIKYESPIKDNGKPSIRVKSFVSDEYKDLVELAALH